VARPEKTPGSKPITRRTPSADGNGATAKSDGAVANGEVKRTEVKGAGVNGSGTDGAGTSRPGAGGPTRPPARRSRKRR
jgi:hypothetical protein